MSIIHNIFKIVSQRVTGNFWLFFLLFISISCSKNETEVLDDSTFAYDYYPIAIGKEWIYRTDSILFSLRSKVVIDTSYSYVRELVTDTFRDGQNRLIYRLEVYRSDDGVSNWSLTGTNYIEINNLHLIKRENGLSFVRLVFPVSKNKAWDGNVYIQPKTQINVQGELIEPYEHWFYYYSYIDKPETIESKHYDKVCLVEEVDDENIIQKRYSIAKYARNVGMIYREVWFLDTQNTQFGLPFIERAEKGLILRQYLVSYQ